MSVLSLWRDMAHCMQEMCHNFNFFFWGGGLWEGNGLFFLVTSLKCSGRSHGLKELLLARLGLLGHPGTWGSALVSF